MKPRIIVIGDIMLDNTYWCERRAKNSAEAEDCPVLMHGNDGTVLGGAGNVAANVVGLGGICGLFGVIGLDMPGSVVEQHLEANGVGNFMVQTNGRKTTMKIRIKDGEKLMMRIDMEDALPIPDEIAAEFLRAMNEVIGDTSAVIISDYAKGVVTPQIASETIRMASARGVPIIVDTKTPLAAHFAGATIIKPNLPEIAAALGCQEPETDEEAGVLASILRARSSVPHVVLTRGGKGLTLASFGVPVHIPAHAVEVVDVTGAGDSVAAALAVSLAKGDEIETAARFANAAGAVAVSTGGTAIPSVAEIGAIYDRDHCRRSVAGAAFAVPEAEHRLH